jgi:hypothetical protein
VASGARRFDLGAAIGSDFWASGLAGTAQPSFAFTLAAGYTFAGGSPSPVHFRMGLMLGYTFLDEALSKETFTAILIDPSLRIRAGGERVFVHLDLGVGALGVSGLKPTSALLSKDQALMINGTQGMLEVRPAAAVEVRLTQSVGVFAGPAIAASPKKDHFHAAITRVELLLGLQYRL